MIQTLELPTWAIACALLFVVTLAAVAVVRVGTRPTFGFFGQVVASLLLVAVAWIYLERLDAHDRTEQRRAIEARLGALTAQSLAPNSNLACLDSDAGALVQEACEKALYSSPENVSAALAYVGGRIDVLREIAARPDAEETVYTRIRAPLARNLEADRYGLVAQVLQARDGCTPDSCYAFDLVQQPDQLAANMKERAYDARVVRYASGWTERPSSPALASHAPQQTPPFSPVNINFPTASSIPPVSIMSNEPGMPGQNGVDATAKPERSPSATSPRRPTQKAQAPRPTTAQPDPFPQPVTPPQQTTGAPAQISPQ